MKRLNNQVAIVTGAGRGIGKAIASHYAREGAKVVIAELDESLGKKLEGELTSSGAEALFIKTDVSKLADIEALTQATQQYFGSIDVLVNNAGVTKSLGFFEVSEDDWDWIHGVTSKGLFFCMQSVARVMKAQGHGRIVNIASIAGKGYPSTSNISYAGAKGAVIAMTRIAASTLASDNINVNAICPGVTRTELYYEVVKGKIKTLGKSEAEIIEMFDGTIPIKRSNEPEDIADLAVFLASNEARNVTGQSWNVDGGLVCD
ncbi:MAG: glucose 1-dehydrogenase [Gammaproteobacteria bacterium]|nr:glucose 1-dehydrogenase [Gammaproteobacteria bacterium]MBQ0838918.1 glucose 1-dehydrogenase [Gammaproteobacteria bacterium]